MAVRIGVFGGSYDPVHRGHTAVAESVQDQRGLDRLLLVPAARPPHKEGGCEAPFRDRVAMLRLAIGDRPGIRVSELEGRRGGPSYTVDTLEELARENPGARLELLVGADMLADLPRWHRAREIPGRARIVAFRRPGVPWEEAVRTFREAFGEPPVVLDVPRVQVSSTDVRRRLAEGRAVGDLLEPEVLEYIRKRGLYGVSKEG